MSQTNIEAEIAPDKQTFMQRVIKLREQYITDRQFTLILSFLVGLFAAIAAFVLHGLIRQIAHLLTSRFDAST